MEDTQDPQAVKMRLAVLEHQTSCWEAGPVKQLRADVAKMVALQKAFFIIISLITASNAAISLYGKVTQRIPSHAQASEIVK